MHKEHKTIIAIGGGGFTHEPENPLLDLYVLKQSYKKIPKICLLPTANSNPELYCSYFEKSFSRFDCQRSSLSLFAPHTADIEGFLLSQDIIYVGGGNTKSMLALWREWGVDRILRKAWEEKIVLAGVSAGAICWFEQGTTDSIPEKISLLSGLGFIKGACCPHYDSEPMRQSVFQSALVNGVIENGYILDDGVALHFTDDVLKRAISSAKGKKAAFLDQQGRHELLVDYLGDTRAHQSL
jgi:peptidase E